MTEAEIKKAQKLIGRVVYMAQVFEVASDREELRRCEDKLLKAVADWRPYKARLCNKYGHEHVSETLGIVENDF